MKDIEPFSMANAPVIESALKMETALNLAWALLATGMLFSWLQLGAPFSHKRGVQERRLQLVALAVLLLILLPAISLTDDLQTIQNPAEAGCCLRRDHVVSHAHSIFPAIAALPVPAFAELPFGFLGHAAPHRLHALIVDHPGLTSIQNRPPPGA